MNLDILNEEVSEIGEPLPSQARVEKETLCLKWDRSEYSGDEDESIIQNHFPNVQRVTIANAGLWLHAENPDDFFDAVIKFIK